MAESLTLLLGMLRREMLLSFRRRAETLAPIWFTLIVATAFPLALGPESAKLAAIAGGVIWVVFLLASLLSLDTLFRSDVEDGSLDLMHACRRSLTLITSAKLIISWLSSALPLILLAPVLAYAYDLDQEVVPVLVVSLLLGTPIVTVFGALAAALTAHARRGGVLLSLIVLPLTMPVLIFGAGAVDAVLTGGSARQPLLFLAAGTVVAVGFGPALVAASLKHG